MLSVQRLVGSVSVREHLCKCNLVVADRRSEQTRL